MAVSSKIDVGVMPLSAPGFITTWRCRDVRGVIVVYETEAAAVREVIDPSPFDYVAPNVWVFAAELAEHDLVPYRDCWHYFAWFVPVRFQGRLGKFGAFQYADDITAILAGRELLGESKKWADFEWEDSGGRVRSTVSLHGQQAVELEIERDPEGEPVDIKEAFLGGQAEVPEGTLPDFNLRSLPSPVPGEPPLRQVIINALELDGEREPARLRSLRFPSVTSDPEWLVPEGLDRFPVQRPLAATYLRGAFTNGCRPGLELISIP